MMAAIAKLLPAGHGRQGDAEAVALAVDDTIVRAQMGACPDASLRAFSCILRRYGVVRPMA